MAHTALVAGSTGIVGSTLARHLADEGWAVHGLARRPGDRRGVAPVAADLQDAASLAAALRRAAADPRLRHDLDAPADRGREHAPSTAPWCATCSARCAHATLRARGAGDGPQALPRALRGLRQRDAAGRRRSARSQARLAGRELLLRPGGRGLRRRAGATASAGACTGRTRSIGFALGNAMNMGVTLAVYASAVPRARAGPFLFPGSAAAVERPDRHDRRAPARPPARLGVDRPRPAATRPSTWSTATSSAGAGCGSASPAGSASIPRPSGGTGRRWSGRWRRTAPAWAAGRAARPRRARPRPPRLALAHGRRPRPADRGGHRHGQEPQARLPRLPGDATRLLRPVRAPAAREGDPLIRPVQPEMIGAPGGWLRLACMWPEQ